MATWFYDAMKEDPQYQRLVKLREALRPLIETLRYIYKADGYYLKVRAEEVRKLAKAFKEADNE